ncbi:MAG: hypothetical protein JWM93_1336 [Frankiales bacterium]|nr:hypothetical protein [Frankiales bacterium]
MEYDGDRDGETERPEELSAYNVPDTPPEAAFDDITRVAAHVTGAPTALVTLVDGDRQWFKSAHNLALNVRESARNVSFCANAILQDDVMVIPDLSLDSRFSEHPLVALDPAIRFYAGAPLRTESGLRLGALCVVDYEPRTLTEAQTDALRSLARQVMKELELRKRLHDLAATVTGQRQVSSPGVLQAIVDNAPAVIFLKDVEGRYLMVNKEFERLHGVQGRDVIGQREATSMPRAVGVRAVLADVRALETMAPVTTEIAVLDTEDVEHTFHAVKFPLLDWAGRPFAVATIAADITDRIRYEEHLEYLADHDALTGLGNRRRFERELAMRLRELRREGGSGAVLVLDIDNLKHVNDSAGHQAGDQYILSIGERMLGVLRETDQLARLGGDEFGVLVWHADEESARVTVQRLLEAVRDHSLDVGGRVVRATASIGCCVFSSGDLTRDDVQAAADTALYAAKDAGRDRAVFANEVPVNALPRFRATWVDKLRDATLGVGFEMVAQPVIDLDSGHVSFHELLLRMRNDQGDLVLPGAFLPAAERFDLIQSIDRWVVEHAVDWLADAQSRGVQLRFSVNVSGKSLRDDDLFNAVRSNLSRAGVDPSALIFEVTETVALANLNDAVRMAQRVRSLGCGFALDDFGAGFGSFYYLKHLPLDIVKIDGDFVRQLTDNRFDQLVIESVVRLSQELGYRTVAEYVPAHAVEMLRSLGVDCGQGFALGLPRPVGELIPAV